MRRRSGPVLTRAQSRLFVGAASLVIDAAFGEPPSRMHPVVGMGSLFSAIRGSARASGKGRERAEGAAGWALVVAASTLDSSVKSAFDKDVRGGNVKGAEAVGKAIAERSIEKGIKRVVFDRSGFLYHGRIRAVADAARKARLPFCT